MLELLKESEALLSGHFLLSSGRHSDGYVQCAKLLQDPVKAELAFRNLCEDLKKIKIDKVVGPAMGGIIVAYEIGRQLGKPAIFTERVDNEMTIRRGFEIKKGERILVTEDVVTTGKSALEAIKVIEEHGGKVVGIASLVDRGESDIDYPIYSAVEIDINTYDKDECPMCKEGLDLVKPGSRAIK